MYTSVDDADTLHAEWLAAGVGALDDLWDPGFGVWESAHTDPDGNVIRFGSPVREGGPPLTVGASNGRICSIMVTRTTRSLLLT